MNRKDIKIQNITQLGLAVAITILLCYITSFVFFRVDLTQEKRYTLSDVSKQILKQLPDEVFIRIYLEGDIPSGFKHLNKSIHEMLDEFRIYSGNNIQYQFIDPYESNDPKTLNTLVQDLYKKGIQPTNVKIKDAKGGYSEKLVIPGALITYNGIEIPVTLLSNNPGISGEENLNNSIQELEYNLINAIHSISNTKLEKIAFLEGQGELNQYQVGDITRELANYYQVDRGMIEGKFHSLDPYKCVIIAKPQTTFSEEDKFVLDQYLMNGGKILWFVNPVKVDADSIAKGSSLAFIQQLNIEDQLFKYGIRINPSIIQDHQCSLVPVNTSLNGTQPKFTPVPWLYFPLLNGSPDNAVSRNLNMIKAEYSCFIDTLQANGKLNKTILLQSSKYSRIRNVPSFISLGEIRQKLEESDFNLSYLPVAVLVEGKFPSVFKNRILANLKIKDKFTFREVSVPTKILVVADGNIIRNDIRKTADGTLISQLGFDKYTSQVYGNKEFILNAVNYINDETGLMKLRSREIKLRLLDKTKIAEEHLKWQLINVVVPILFVIIIGIVFSFWRRKIYSR